MGDRERKDTTGSDTPSQGLVLEAREGEGKGGGVAVPSAVDLELLEEIYWSQRKISQVRSCMIKTTSII